MTETQAARNLGNRASPVLALVAMLLAVALLSGCGGGTEDPRVPSTPSNGNTGLAGNQTWQSDSPFGGQPGNAAQNAEVLLGDGSTATLEELANGKPLLLYFFVTW